MCSASNVIINSSLLFLFLFLSTASADATQPVERGYRHHRRSAASAGAAGTVIRPSMRPILPLIWNQVAVAAALHHNSLFTLQLHQWDAKVLPGQVLVLSVSALCP